MLQSNNLFAKANCQPSALPGVSMTLAVQSLLQSQEAIDEIACVVRQQVAKSMSVTLTLQQLGDGRDAIQALESFCSRLRDAGIPGSSKLGLCLSAPSIPLRAYALITRCRFGAGPRYVLLDGMQMQHRAAESEVDGVWGYLWRHRSSRWAVLPAYGESVSTPCPLLADEAANAVLPGSGIQAPAGSAWLPVRLHLPHFADDKGVICIEALDKALVACVDAGDRLLDQHRWPSAGMHDDARANRRIAIQVAGFGDLVRLQKRNPSDLGVLQSLSKLAEHVRTTVWNHSTQIARRSSDLLPAIAQHEPALTACDDHNRSWAARWQEAVERSAVRHRNLIVMSPYAVLPVNDGGCAAFTDLLPVIAHADAHSFAAPPPFRGWKIEEFSHFHRRAWAVMQRRNAISLVATRA
jgi:hypothetical protein